MEATIQNSNAAEVFAVQQIRSLGEIAMRYRAQNQPEKAAPIFQLTLDIAEQSFEPYDPRIIAVMMDVCWFYTGWSSRPLEAQDLCRRTLDLCERVLGYRHRNTIGALSNLIVLLNQDPENLPKDYEKLLRRAVKGYRNLDGAESEAMHAFMYNLAVYLQVSGRLDEAEEIFDERLGLIKTKRGEPHPSTSLAAGNLAKNSFHQCYTAIILEKYPADDVRALRPLVRVLELCMQFPSNPYLLVPLGRMFKYTGDDVNTHIAFHSVVVTTDLKFQCNGCSQIIDCYDFFMICRVCAEVGLCRLCYDAYQTTSSRPRTIPDECENHGFLDITMDRRLEVDLDTWLQEVHALKTGALEETIRQKEAQNAADYYHGQSADANYIFSRPDGVPDDLNSGSLQAKSVAWLENLERCTLESRFLTARERIPRMLSYWFTSAGFQRSDLPKWNIESDPTVELQHHIDAIFRLALRSSESQLAPIAHRVEYKPRESSVYANEDMILDSEIPQIRVLRLLSCDARTVRAEMSRISIPDGPAYDALSYVWGAFDSPAQKTLEINGKIMRITPNLHQALCSLLQDNSLRQLWVDAVCINQEDLEEKGNQISMMADIYKHASRVRIYLGSALPSLTNYLQFIGQIPGSTDESSENMLELEDTEHFQKLPKIEDPQSKSWTLKVFSELGLSKELLLNDYVDFISRPWWSRVWILQEYALAQREPVLYLGDASIKSSALKRCEHNLGFEMLRAAAPFSGFDADTELLVATMTLNMRQMRAVLNNRHIDRGGVTFGAGPGQLFDWYFRLKSTDPRDRIFGLRELLDRTAKEWFRPDYTMDVVGVYLKLATWLLMFDNDVEMFWRYPLKIDPAAPSWVPNFSRPHSWIPEGIDAQDHVNLELSRSLAFGQHERNLTGLVSLKGPPPVIYNRVLAVGGYHIDTIDRVFPLNGGTWQDRLAKLWYLDAFFTSTNLGTFRRPSDSFFTVLESHATDMLFAWSTESVKGGALSTLSIAAYSQGLSITEFANIVDQEFSLITAHLVEPVLDNSFAGRAWFIQLAARKLRQTLPFLSPGQERMGVPIGCAKVTLNLTNLQNELITLNNRPLNFLGAALFDYQNLERQLRNLIEPRLAPSFLQQVEPSILAKLNSIADRTFPEPDNSEELPPLYDLTPYIYDELQEQVCACETKEEVRLRVALVLRTAQALRKAASRTLSVTENEERIGDSFLETGNHLEPDMDNLKKNLRWLHADDAAIIQMRNLTCGSGIAAISAFLYSRSSTISRFTRYANLATVCFAACAALGYINLRNRFGLSSDSPWASGGLPTEEEATYWQNQRLEWEERERKGPVAQGKRKDYTRTFHEIETQWQNRTFYVTKRGFVGLGTPGVTDIREGDKVVWLDNCRLPMVVREKSGMENLHIVGFSIVREFINENSAELEDFKRLQKRVFRFA